MARVGSWRRHNGEMPVSSSSSRRRARLGRLTALAVRAMLAISVVGVAVTDWGPRYF